MPDFVFEIGTEEIPARFLPRLRDQLVETTGRLLQEQELSAEVTSYATPRRLVVYASQLPAKQPVREELVTGPPVAIAYDDNGEPTKAAQGFAKSQGVEVNALFSEQTERGAYLAVRKTVGGNDARELLPRLCQDLLAALSFPKSMRWEASQATFARPVRWLLALLDREIVPVEAVSLTAGRQTFGHRTMGAGPWEVPEAASYFDVLRDKGRVILDVAERTRRIREEAEAQASAHGGRVAWDESLLGEVADLVEWPQAVLGGFDASFLELPRAVLLTSMQSHQKSFGVENEVGELLPYFVCTLNLVPQDLDLVRKGWERVLRARLEDARFFWQVDGKASLATWLDQLDKVIFLGPLGSMGDKARRLEGLAGEVAARVAPEAADSAQRAGRLAKTDLVSEMVGEFAELQGLMGGVYTRQKGEAASVAQAVAEHYLPTGPESVVPSNAEGAVVALADKADTLVGCFGLDMVPSGANDPYALRRQALGIIRILLEYGWRLSLRDLLSWAQQAYATNVQWKSEPGVALQTLETFFGHRLKAYFQGRGYETKIVDAALGAGWDDVPALAQRLDALHGFAAEEDFEQAVLTFKRADNIIRKQGTQVDADLDGEYSTTALQEEQEKILAAALEDLAPRWAALWEQEAFDDLFGLLRELRPAVDGFFDHVMVMCDDPELRHNRLNLLKALTDRLSLLADFSKLQV